MVQTCKTDDLGSASMFKNVQPLFHSPGTVYQCCLVCNLGAEVLKLEVVQRFKVCTIRAQLRQKYLCARPTGVAVFFCEVSWVCAFIPHPSFLPHNPRMIRNNQDFLS